MHTPLHFHVLLALFKRLNEKLPSISPDQTCLEKEGFKLVHPYPAGASNYSVPDQLQHLENSWIWGMTQVDTIWGPSRPTPRFIDCHHDFTLNTMMGNDVSSQLRTVSCFLYNSKKTSLPNITYNSMPVLKFFNSLSLNLPSVLLLNELFWDFPEFLSTSHTEQPRACCFHMKVNTQPGGYY